MSPPTVTLTFRVAIIGILKFSHCSIIQTMEASSRSTVTLKPVRGYLWLRRLEIGCANHRRTTTVAPPQTAQLDVRLENDLDTIRVQSSSPITGVLPSSVASFVANCIYGVSGVIGIDEAFSLCLDLLLNPLLQPAFGDDFLYIRRKFSHFLGPSLAILALRHLDLTLLHIPHQFPSCSPRQDLFLACVLWMWKSFA